MTSRQHKYLHQTKSGRVLRLVVNVSEKRKRAYAEFDLDLDKVPEEWREEATQWASFVKEELKAGGYLI